MAATAPTNAESATRVAFVAARDGDKGSVVIAMKAEMPDRVPGKTAGGIARHLGFRLTNVTDAVVPQSVLNVAASATHGPGHVTVPELAPGASVNVDVVVQPAYGRQLAEMAGYVSVRLLGNDFVFPDSVSFYAPTLRSEQQAELVRVLLVGPAGGGKSSLAVTAATLMSRPYGMSWATPTGGQAMVADPAGAIDGDASHTTAMTYVVAPPFLLMDGPGAASTWQSKGRAAASLPLLQMQLSGVAARGMSMDDMRGLSDEDRAVLEATAEHRRPHVVVFCAPARMLLENELDAGIKAALDALRDYTPLIAATAIDDDLLQQDMRITAADLAQPHGAEMLERLRLAIAEKTRLDGQTIYPVMSYTDLDTRQFAVDQRVFALLEGILSVTDDKVAQKLQRTEEDEDWRVLLQQ